MREGGREGEREGGREGEERWERWIKKGGKRNSTNFIQTKNTKLEGGGRKGRKEIGTTQCCQSYLLKGKGHGITQGRQGMC